MKKTIRLTESQLNKVIRNAVKYALNEQEQPSTESFLGITRVQAAEGDRAIVFVADKNQMNRYAKFIVIKDPNTGNYVLDQSQKMNPFQNEGLTNDEVNKAKELISLSSKTIVRNWNKSLPGFNG